MAPQTKPTMEATPSPLLSKVADFLSQTKTHPQAKLNEPILVKKAENDIKLPQRQQDEELIKESGKCDKQVEIDVEVINIRKAMEEYEAKLPRDKTTVSEATLFESQETTLEEGIAQYIQSTRKEALR